MMLALVASLVLAAPPPALTPAQAEAALEAAQRCARRADHACAARESQKAVDSSDGVIAREARSVYALALALMGAPDAPPTPAIIAAFDSLLTAYPAWRPPPDADARVVTAFGAARRERLRARLPTVLDAGPPPEAPRPTPEQIAPLLPPARYYVPPIVKGPSYFGLSLGAGIGLPSSDRVGPGLHAAIDFRWLASELWSLWIQGTLALLPLDDALPIEPGHGRGLTAFSVVVGTELRLPIADRFEALAALGFGFGGFGYTSPGDATGPTLAGALGVRWQADENLALRADVAPVMVLGAGDGIGPGGHIAIVLRGETRF